MTSAFNGADLATQALLRENGLGPAEPERDGCRCPPWVIRCVHYDGDVLVLASRDVHHSDAASVTHRARCNPAEWFPFSVAVVSGEWEPCPGNCGFLYPTKPGKRIPRMTQRYPTEADALAAFHAAELELLGRDAD